ncbi:MAG: acyl-CoA dehydratase activase [Tissierellia bacterium]|nr:acyl-CoA dehydratase activase [Tissierellia bacterium]
MKYFGVDLGSTAAKVATLNEKLEVLDLHLIENGASVQSVDKTLEYLAYSVDEEHFIISTGYGRKLITDRYGDSSEIICHAKGVKFLTPEARTIIDIGGQDIKIIELTGSGKVQNFHMNDKCAAGTGRFLEVMARLLGVEVSDLSNLAENSVNKLSISNICTVFAESEVISLLAKGHNKEDVARAVNESVSKRIASQLMRSNPQDRVIITGGASLNRNLVHQLSSFTGKDIMNSKYSQFTGAIGAAIIGIERSRD